MYKGVGQYESLVWHGHIYLHEPQSLTSTSYFDELHCQRFICSKPILFLRLGA